MFIYIVFDNNLVFWVDLLGVDLDFLWVNGDGESEVEKEERKKGRLFSLIKEVGYIVDNVVMVESMVNGVNEVLKFNNLSNK